ncbi:tripartite tricarboxylate transporter permease [Chelativorans sp. SCAU2101]|uniref:Tripartite tricarboxylate transporter permease n=1 Tax=Chelativorans petroleitrophicus TaxID=2975484 RepID=A0A9X2X7C2_9HYPH|nr:tripartite tricarboxylate transporter permease [Chelativorans petroleitrophicus]MCT8989889.1 tripartite tricarboxylate transporter permease [Chelativorans petroleitrophicus]
MEFISNLSLGFSVAFALQNIFFCFIGVLGGTLVGVLPGVGPLATIAILLPVTFSMAPDSALIMLAGIYYGAQYGGSTTAILLNLPGEASSAITTLDGYQMARRGRAGAALATAALASFLAGTIATVIVALFATPLTKVAMAFRPPSYFSMMVLGLIASVVLAHGSVLKAIAMVMLGLLLGIIGTDMYTGTTRLDMGMLELAEGVNFVALAIGLFGIAEILRNLESPENRDVLTDKVNGLWLSLKDLKRIVMPSLRGTAIGSALGILPGGGAMLSSYAAYIIEKKVSRNRGEMGNGAIEGVAAPEAANNAGSQTAFIPMLTLGLPSNAVMALMIGAMIIQGIQPGPDIIIKQPNMFWGLIVSMWIGNLMLIVLNLPLIGLWVRFLTVPYPVLVVAVMAFSAVGIYSASGTLFSMYELGFFSLLGYVFMRLGCEPAPLVLGFILGPMMEEQLRRSMLMSRGDPTVFLTEPISLCFLIAAAAALLLITAPAIARRREEAFSEE